MFGYVRPPELPPEELERFRRMYCGLCHALGQKYGQAARMILNYDLTYLAILLSPHFIKKSMGNFPAAHIVI